MKSLILKDLYNIGHNAKSMILILLFLAAVLIPSSGVEGYIVVSALMCSMMMITTFAFDNSSRWTRYAMIMPISKKDVVTSKFVVLLIFSAIGALFGGFIGIVGGVVTNKITFDTASILQLLSVTLVALIIAMIFGGTSITLVFKFGAEKGRMLLLFSVLIPGAIGCGIYLLLSVLGVELTDQLVFILLCVSPLIAFLWDYAMYKISYKIFSQQEL